jgi:hypothetical protein
MKELKIDVDNLCSFMPQDKVQIPTFFLELFILLSSIVCLCFFSLVLRDLFIFSFLSILIM